MHFLQLLPGVLRVLIDFDAVEGIVWYRCSYQLLDVGVVSRPSLLQGQASYRLRVVVALHRGCRGKVVTQATGIDCPL
jgi:hypothetical protein